jgi:hydrolase, nudix family
VVFKYHCYYLSYWIQKDQIPNLDLAYDMLPLMEMMEAPDKSEFFYRHRTEDGWEKEIF